MILDLKKVFLDENESLSADVTVDLTDYELNGRVLIPEPVKVSLSAKNHAGVVILDAQAAADCHFLCDRCAEPSAEKLAFSFRHILVTELSDDSGDDYIEAPDYKLDTDALLRDDILLELPSKFLCKKSCKGLCPKCGKNLNEGECSCPKREPHPGLAALSKLLID